MQNVSPHHKLNIGIPNNVLWFLFLEQGQQLKSRQKIWQPTT